MKVSAVIFFGYLTGLIAVYFSNLNQQYAPVLLSKLVFLFSVLPGVVFLLFKYRSGLGARRGFSLHRFVCKSLGMSSLLIVLLFYSLLMSNLGVNPFSSFVFDLPLLVVLSILILPAYIAWSDVRLRETEDGYYQLGRLLIERNYSKLKGLKKFLLSWLVKILFIPIMYGALIDSLSFLLSRSFSSDAMYFVTTLFWFGLSFDLIIATSGYLFSSPLLKNEVISTDENFWGWLVCLVCYAPFLVVMQHIREIADYVYWTNWLDSDHWLYWLWAVLITATWMGYWVSTACFGLRFSNLSWRGLVNWGPYKYFKHPAYISKNIYWWLHAVPFVGFVSLSDLLLKVSVLVGISTIYYFRAVTEEQHLKRFPEYIAYSQYIDNFGFFARIRKIWEGRVLWQRGD